MASDAQDYLNLQASDPNVLVNLAVQKINQRDFKGALELYNMVKVESKEKLVGRGTALMLLGHKEQALEDFTRGLELFPRDPDLLRRRANAFEGLDRRDEALDRRDKVRKDGHSSQTQLVSILWKCLELFPRDADLLQRRANAFKALDCRDEAFEDISLAIELEPMNEEARHMRGALAFHTQDFWTALEDFKVAVQLRPTDPIVNNALGMAYLGAGKYAEAAAAFTAGVKAAPDSSQLWSEKGRAHKEMAEVEEAEKALRKSLQLQKSTVVYHRLASLKHLTGYHSQAQELAEEGLRDNPGDVELNYIAAACKHARGDFVAAIQHYDAILKLNPGPEATSLQFLAFYQREILAYTLVKGDQPLDNFQVDDHFPSTFKVHWVKKMNPMGLFPGYNIVELTAEHVMRGKVDNSILTPDALDLIRAADRIGAHAQYFVSGFMPNKRQYRMAGLAALDLMQRARATWEAMRKGWVPNSGQGHKDADEDDEDDDVDPAWAKRRSGRSGSGKRANLITSWRSMFNTLVRWRQLSEPGDTIAWIDGLGEAYIEGFGSITAMTVGQMENLKYYPEYKRSFELMKQRLYESEEAMNGTGAAMHVPREQHGDTIMAATTRKKLWKVIGENFYVTTQCYSYHRPGLIMNGTQLTLVESTKSYDFAIRTPVTDDRMKDFGIEMQHIWEEMSADFLNDDLREEDPFMYNRKLKDSILKMGYYWFQLMPLARGSAMVGLISMHGLSMAADMEITEFIPKGLQIDWESILAPKFEMFNASVDGWFFRNTREAPLDLPNVMQTLPTVRHVLAALSYENY